MASPAYVLVLDQGSTSSRAVLYDRAGKIVFLQRTALETLLPGAERVEHDPSALFDSQIRALRGVRKWLGKGGERRIAAVGVTNQRSTFLLWERKTGRPLCRAISWQDRRGEESCIEMARHQDNIRARTGLRLTPHSTIAKLRWVLRHVEGARKKAQNGDLVFGTVNTYLIWRLTGGRVHATDDTNASRTLMMNLRTRAWDPELLSLFEIPPVLLPRIQPTSASYGEAAIGRCAVPILASIGDQQASLCGQGGFRPGHLALTYGTGGFLLWNVGERPQMRTSLLSTVAWSAQRRVCYGLEGTVNAVGSAILWLKHLGLIARLEEIDDLCRASRQEVAFVPALAGLGSPHYRPVETALFGLKRTTTRADLVRGLIEGVAYLMKDNYERMKVELRAPPRTISAGGGAAQCRWLVQFQADLFGREIGLSNVYETTSRGAAYLAGLERGFWRSLDSLDRAKRPARRFLPRLSSLEVEKKYARWQRALELAGEWKEASPTP
ncbi:MAG: FGGY family carbohydrate kinase [Thermoanaerobaculia bacterium]